MIFMSGVRMTDMNFGSNQKSHTASKGLWNGFQWLWWVVLDKNRPKGMYHTLVTFFYEAFMGPKMAVEGFFWHFKAHRGHTLQLFMAHVICPCLKLYKKTILDAFCQFKWPLWAVYGWPTWILGQTESRTPPLRGSEMASSDSYGSF